MKDHRKGEVHKDSVQRMLVTKQVQKDGDVLQVAITARSCIKFSCSEEKGQNNYENVFAYYILPLQEQKAIVWG